MSIRVRFSEKGFHHPAFGRLGRGKNAGQIYKLPDSFAEKETIKVPIMDNTSKPPKKIGEKEVTRFKNLPESAEIISEDEFAEMQEEAADAGEKVTAVTPTVATPEQLDKVTGKGHVPKAQSAQERTTGRKPAKRKSARAK